jgi:hypothetical protein
MSVYILFWVKSFLLAHPICPCLWIWKCKDKTPCLYNFQDKNESQNIWDKLFSCKLFATKKFIPYVLASIFILKNYINKLVWKPILQAEWSNKQKYKVLCIKVHILSPSTHQLFLKIKCAPTLIKWGVLCKGR